jgi:hypothetical protein
MIEYKFRFYGDSVWSTGPLLYNKATMIAWTSKQNDVNVSVPRLKTIAKEHKVSFERAFSEAVSHEIIHNIVFRMAGFEACEDFDNICVGKQEKVLGKVDLRKFHGGLPWWTE